MSIYMWRTYIPPELGFTANTANSTVQLVKNGTPYTVTLEYSTDGKNWSTYTFGTTVTLSSVGSSVYFRNASTSDKDFNVDGSNYYGFVMSGSISSSGDVGYLLNKNKATTTYAYCFYNLFYNCTALKSCPSFTATTVQTYAYYNMFNSCTGLTTLPKLPATSVAKYGYGNMFRYCTGIKLSTTQTGEYQTAYRIPPTGSVSVATNAFNNMFANTGGTFTGNPSGNTTYYTSNTLV